MTTATGLLALALLGGNPPEPDQISYEIRIIDTRADDWRPDNYRHCTRVGREGKATAWTIEDAKVKALIEAAVKRPESSAIFAPKATVFAGHRVKAVVDTRRERSFIADLDRVITGPSDKPTAVALRPVIDRIEEGVTVGVCGHREGKAISTRIKLDSNWIGHIATGSTTETVENKGHGKASITGKVQLPQVVEAKLEGDYTIPEDRTLLISLGTATTVDGWNRPIVRERLALIKPRVIVLEPEVVRIDRPKADAGVVRTGFEPAPRPMPPLPSRAVPVPIGPDGNVVPARPTTDEQVKPANHVGPPVPRPSPQTQLSVGVGMIDPSVAPAGMTVPADAARSHSIRFHLGGRLAVEVKAFVQPIAKPE